MDMSGLAKLMAKKKSDKPLDEGYKTAKMSMLQALKDEMGKMMGDDLKAGTMKKVEVAAPDKEGLSEGLDKAKDLVQGDDESAEGDEEAAEGEEPMNGDSADKMLAGMIGHEADEGELDDAKIDALIELLQKKKAEKQMK